MKKSGHKAEHGDGGERGVREVLHDLLDRSRDPSRLLEAYYWSTEPDLAEFVRQFLSLSEATRNTLIAFLGMTREAADSVAVTIGLNGEITLSSPVVSDAMKMGALTTIPSEPSGSMH